MSGNGSGSNGRFTAQEMAEALTETRGFVTHAARRLGCSRRTVQRYIAKHPTVREARDDAKESLKDHAEIKLVEAINVGNMTAIIFFLKTQAKDRGYIEKYQVDSKVEVEDKRAKTSDAEILEEAKEIINFRETNTFTPD